MNFKTPNTEVVNVCKHSYLESFVSYIFIDPCTYSLFYCNNLENFWSSGLSFTDKMYPPNALNKLKSIFKLDV